MSSFVPGWLQKQSINLCMAANLREIGEHKGRSELNCVQSLTIVDALRNMTAEHSAAAAARLEGIENPVEQANYGKLLLEVQGKYARFPVRATTILAMHAGLFQGTGVPAGQCRNGESIMAVESLCENYCRQEGLMDPVLLTGAFVFDFYSLQPFAQGNERTAQLLASWLLQKQDYCVSRFVSLERIMEETKTEYAEALNDSSVGWHASRHDMGPWWSYWLGILVKAYRTFTARTLVLAKRRGVKTDLILNAMKAMPDGFTLRQIQQQLPGCGIELIRKICKAEKAAGRIRCMGRGPNTLWRVKRKHETAAKSEPEEKY